MQNELARLTTEVTQLRQALDSRAVIDQAQGVIMALTPCPAERAWQVLVETSQHGNTKLRDVATALVAAVAHGHGLPPGLRVPLDRAVRRARAGGGGAGPAPGRRVTTGVSPGSPIPS
ncbi:ANTAR domain-containing protein [Streptomyces sp. NPDC047821]|uniref:ANTAR domain-containing protein n=1 Tax=Streptomyces sp. NPDC047821 TaxID=3365488 RepID=UPI00371CC983